MQRLRKMQQQEELGVTVRQNSMRGARRKLLLSYIKDEEAEQEL